MITVKNALEERLCMVDKTMTDFERIMNHFNAIAKCKRRDAKPQLGYLPGCAFIECEHEKCACRMNDGEGLKLSEFIAKWNGRHG